LIAVAFFPTEFTPDANGFGRPWVPDSALVSIRHFTDAGLSSSDYRLNAEEAIGLRKVFESSELFNLPETQPWSSGILHDEFVFLEKASNAGYSRSYRGVGSSILGAAADRLVTLLVEQKQVVHVEVVWRADAASVPRAQP
jgi:hypothetical protein